MKMKYTILYVNDVEASIHFYQHVLGFPIKLRVESYVEFDTGDVTLSINSRQDVKDALGLPVPEANQSSQTVVKKSLSLVGKGFSDYRAVSFRMA
ncbi:VOC family protein [Bacillus sp. 7788]|uniref:VOC family protein n=1 Tax=Bacillus sp. 7788 TaxID=2021692 RepID=UPI0020750FC4|nr:VOC family protein [Bacillus sp. 7788]